MAGDGGAGPARSLDGADVPGEAPAAPADVPNERRTEDGQTGERQAEERQADERQPEPPGGTEHESAYPLSPPAEEAPSEPQPMRQAAFMGVALELPSVHPAVVLQEIDAPMRELRVTIAQPEGVAIAYAWRGIATPRPLTHDLLTSILQRFGLQVDAVRITGVDGPVFHAELALSGPTGSHTVECRPSDALALALRQPLPVPIMVAEEVLVTAGRSLGA